MPQIEWFYAKNDQPCGPVSPVELKQFAEQGELHQGDLVWREGMGEWIPAGKIKGLFDSNGEVPAESEPPSGGEVVVHDSPPRGEVPAGAIPNPPPAAAELPIRSTPVTITNEVEEPRVVINEAVSEELDAESAPLRHPFDTLADLARKQFNAHFIRSTIVLFQIGGRVGIFLAIVALLFLATAVGSTTGAMAAAMPLAAVGGIVLIIGQYAAGRLFPAMEELDRTARATVSATGPLDSFAWAMTALALTSLIGLAAFAIATSTAWPAFLAVVLFVVCQFTAVVAWNPRGVWFDIGPPTTPGREAAALVCFLGKLLWRLSIVAFGAGIVLGSVATLNVAVHIGLPDEPAATWYATEMFVPLGLMLVALPLPVFGYLGFLACQLLSEMVLAGLGNTNRKR